MTLKTALLIHAGILAAGAVVGWLGWSLSGIARGRPPLETLGSGLVLMLAGVGFWWLMMALPLPVRRPFEPRKLCDVGTPAGPTPTVERLRIVLHPLLTALAVAGGVSAWDWRSGGAPYAVMFVGWLGASALRQYQRYIRVDDEEERTGMRYVLRRDAWLLPWG